MLNQLHLEWVRRERNCFRFYAFSIEDNLFGDSSLVVHWGRIGRLGEQKILASGSAAELRIRAQRLAREKTRKGYSAPQADLDAWRLSGLDRPAKDEGSMVVSRDLFAI